ncbi:MAG: hypothetical protein DPW09_29010 [Anaerolineae bacterium]|nr:hypothetical protein [Anaerolineales bacterium]MCQ3977489.1 hypothetical protein [Anaerolineae bacterium]
MTAIAELTAPDTLKLPAQITAQFRPSDRFVVWVEGDTVYLKRITPASVVEIVDQAPAEEPLTLDEINELVHQARREQK